MPAAEVFGPVRGRIALGSDATDGAAKLAKSVYDDAEAEEFSGDPVRTELVPSWAPELGSWLPAQELYELGLRAIGTGDELVATVGVDMHTDHIHGPVLCLVLHNDGLAFRQGRHRHRPAAGDWFVFDDSKPHGVKECSGRAVFLGWTVPLESIP